MDIVKELKDISWQVTEPEYRQDPSYSYSTLARYEREGFYKLKDLYTHISTASLKFGSIVDTLITDAENFNNKYIIADEGKLSESLANITKQLFALYSADYNTIGEIPDADILDVVNENSYSPHWRDVTRIKKVREDCSSYYLLLYAADGKEIISNDDYIRATAAVDALKSSPATKHYLEQDNIFDNRIRRYYQLKFKSVFDGIPYRCMLDLLYVDYQKKLIIPMDLKTTSKEEGEFYKSFKEWLYTIQARLYYRILKDNISRDPYFKDFTIANFHFIVVNSNHPLGLLWEYPDTKEEGALTYKDFVSRDPFDIAAELEYYLKMNPETPIGISNQSANNLCEWLNK